MTEANVTDFRTFSQAPLLAVTPLHMPYVHSPCNAERWLTFLMTIPVPLYQDFLKQY